MESSTDTLLYGASGHCKVVSSILESMRVKVHGVFDDRVSVGMLNRLNILGSYKPNYKLELPLIISIGDNKIREKISLKIKHKFTIAIHNSVVMDDFVRLNDGTVVMQNATLQRDVIIGKHCIINTNSSIDHDCRIDDFVHIAPSATLCGNIEVGEGTLIGANSTILPNIKIGKWCIIGAGTVVINDIPNYSVVVGSPGKVIKTVYNE